MVKLAVTLDGDQALRRKFDDLGKAINRWVINAAFKPAIRLFIPELKRRLASAPFSRKKRLIGNLSSGAVRKSRKMRGQRLMSKFGTTDGENDPYYGAFVDYGHRMGPRSLGNARPKTKDKRYQEKTFNTKKSQAAMSATQHLRAAIERLWKANTIPTSGPP